MKLSGQEIIEACGGTILQGDPGVTITGVQIDSRQVKTGDLFIPFRGEQTDGHLYIAAAAAGGAAAAFHELDRKQESNLPDEILLIGVEDSLIALQNLASAYRRRFNLPVIGITGSSGKTTTKDFTAGVLSAKFDILKTTGNLNNEIGLPLTILKLEQQHQAAVLEMGMSAPGEISTLCKIADPSIGIITNIGEAHIELLGSIDAIARAKGELLDYLGSGGVAVLNGDDPRLLKIGRRFPGKVLYYGFNQGDIKGFSLSQRGEMCFFRVRFPDNSEGQFESPLPGRESASNALAALTVGYILGLSPQQMQEGLKQSKATAGRLQVLYNRSGVMIIDDTYNANPASVRAALKVLTDLGGRNSVAVLGDMLELGFAAREAHSSIGRFAADCSIKHLITVGEQAAFSAREAAAAGISAVPCRDHDQAMEVLQRLPLGRGWAVLVKGSRGMQMEKIVERLLNEKEAGM